MNSDRVVSSPVQAAAGGDRSVEQTRVRAARVRGMHPGRPHLSAHGQVVLSAYIAVLPALALFALFVIIPVFEGLWVSLHRWDGLSPMVWTGLDNYGYVLNDGIFWEAMWHTILFAIVTTVAKNALGLGLAVLLNRPLRGRSFFRTVAFMPVTLAFVMIGILWSWVYNPIFGILDGALDAVGLGSLAQGWLSDPNIALFSIMVVDIWKWTGFHMVVYLAGLQQVPTDVLEAASVDGASGRQRFWFVTLPLLRPVIIFNVLLSIVGGFTTTYDLVYVMTGGGPFHSTEVALTWIVSTTMRFLNVGEGSAMSVVLLVIVGAIGLVEMFLMTRGNSEDEVG